MQLKTSTKRGAFVLVVIFSLLSVHVGVTQVAKPDGTLATANVDYVAPTLKHTKCLIIETPVDADNLLFFRAEEALTVTAIDCLVNAATSVPITVQECDANGGTCVAIEAAITCGTTNSTEAAGIDNATVDAGDWLRIDVGVPSGTPGHVAVCINFTIP